MRNRVVTMCGMVLAAFFVVGSPAAQAENLLDDPSFEKPMDRNRWGHVFSEWAGWIFEGTSSFEVGQVARTGDHSLEMAGTIGGKIRMYSKEVTLGAGRYRLTLHLRGLDIGKGRWGTNFDMSVNSAGPDAKYVGMKKPGTFGWTPMTYVFDATEGYKFKLAFGLWEEGHLWVDDASLEKVADDVEVTPAPVFGAEEAPIAMPGPLPAKPARCPNCAYRNDPAWGKCYACGTALAATARTFASPKVIVFADFEDGKRNPFSAGEAVEEHATRGKFSLRLDKSYTTIDTVQAPFQNWIEHDYVVFDVYNPHDKPAGLYIEVRDSQTQGYWTRVNLNTIAPPGKSTVTIPTALYVGEKSRPGRMLIRDQVTRFVVSVGDEGPVFLDNFRLERLDTSAYTFDELFAFDFGPMTAPLMEGFTAAGMATNYSQGRGYGWTRADWWRDFNVLQPDLLTQDFVCPRNAAFRIDLPNGKYHVFLNIDSPGGFWGEVQLYRNRQVTANGETVVDDRMDIDRFTKKYFRNASREDLPGVNTFDEYVETMLLPKRFEVEVTDGTLDLGFRGDGWAISLSTLVVYPDAKRVQGEKFLAWVTERRKKQFEDYFKQMNPSRVGLDRPAAGCRVFQRDFMHPAGAFDGPREGEELKPGGRIELTVAKGEERALVFAVQPAGDLGAVDLAVSKLTSATGAVLDETSLRPGWVDYRISRVQMDGSVYTVSPRYWHPTPAPAAPGVTRNFWVRVKTPIETAPGSYRGTVQLKPQKGEERSVPVQITVLPFALDPITDVPAGPWGCYIGLPWYGNDPAVQDWDRQMFEKSLEAIAGMGCTSFSGYPTIRIRAANGEITLDMTAADAQMKLIRSKGLTQMISSYGAANNIGLYGLYQGPTDAQAKQAGFADAQALVTAAWKAVDDHAVANDWVPVAWNLCDEPGGAGIPPIVKNSKMHLAASKGLKRTFFMGATSMTGDDPKNPHYELCRALQIPSLNLHDEASLAVIKAAGGRPSFYNGGNRWTYGRYMKMLVVKHDLALRLTWHYNCVAGDPYYALDCREDDYCWFNTNEKGELVPSMSILGQILPGLNDYRYLSTLQRLLKEKPGHRNAAAARKVFDEMVDLKAGTDRGRQVDFAADRATVVEAITSLLK
ncbi:MAG TPA: hypothetical protein VMZ92_11730 [Planctomycetota bacterium]|nr:hypothetical protein [Planctomycetota bacterium]